MIGKIEGKRALLVCIDVLLINLAALAAASLRLDQGQLIVYVQWKRIVIPWITFLILIPLFTFGLYQRMWRYATVGELLNVGKAILFGVTSFLVVSKTMGWYFLSNQFYVLFMLFCFFLLGGVRFGDRVIGYWKGNKIQPGKNTLIVGAGGAGALVVRTLRENRAHLRPLAFVDDDPDKKGLRMMNLPILGNRQDIPDLVDRLKIEEIIIAIPSGRGDQIREIAGICGECGVSLNILPSVFKLIDDKLPLSQIREIRLDDLLHREPTQLDLRAVASYLERKIVMVTGGAGSIGSELCRQIAQFKPEKLVIVDHSENGLFELEDELGAVYPNLSIAMELADTKEKFSVYSLFYQYRPQVVFHAAAHKHVPILERCPQEAVKNNVVGSYNLAQAAEAVGCNTLIFISTDKAVEPVSVMGMSKRVGEELMKEMNRLSSTNIASVRFGNVLGSRGSVVPLFQQQIQSGGPITITHPDMCRYFMTIEEAVQLTIQAGAMTRGGETFVLDMGEQVKIVDLATDLIKLSGLRPHKDIALQFTQIRPGEKLQEKLWGWDEQVRQSLHPRIKVVVKQYRIRGRQLLQKIDRIRTEGDRLDRNSSLDFLYEICRMRQNKESGDHCDGYNTFSSRTN